MTNGRKLGLLGGTFDPIHYGHLDAADAAHAALALDEILVIPSHDPPHRPIDPHATRFHRFAMAALAVNDRPHYRVSDIEVARDGPSFSVDTLRALHRDGWRPSQLFFILGADAFAEIATWKAFPSVLDAAHFAVIARRGVTLTEALGRNPQLADRVGTADAVSIDRECTRILLIEADTRDVSSTDIRNRLAARQPIDDLVPSSVARHILAHQLYGAVDDLHGKDEHKNR
jgi:nicotinate-nucleotide adenylyltransferase